MDSFPYSMLLPSQAEDCCMFAIRLRCVSIAPFATPVVPPVYCRKAMSPCSMSTLGSDLPLPRASASLNRIAPSMRYSGIAFFTYFSMKLTMAPFGNDSMSPTPVVTTWRTEVSFNTSDTVAAKLSSTTIADAPESTS
jgi:hypothetical protein